jgi:hypothetical protein
MMIHVSAQQRCWNESVRLLCSDSAPKIHRFQILTYQQMNSKTLFIASALSVICLPTIAAPAQSSDFFEILENDQSVDFFAVPEGAVLSTELRNDGFTTSLSAAADVIDDRTYKVTVPSVAVVGAKKEAHFPSVLPNRRE